MDAVQMIISIALGAAWLILLTLWLIAHRMRRELASAPAVAREESSVALPGWPCPAPPRWPPPVTCPACGGAEIAEVSSGLWDGVDPKTGAHVGGTVFHGVCRTCQARVAQWNDGPAYTPGEEEWRSWA